MNNKSLVITIDGPAGAGKSTVSKILANRLHYKYIDTGALYRAVALAAKNKSIDISDDLMLEKLCEELQLKFVHTEEGLRLLLNNKDITDQIRTPEISMLASGVSARPCVRKFLFKIQREMGKEKEAVFEGRDMGTVVFPEADVKFFLDASHEKRAERRYVEIASKSSQNLEEVKKDMQTRDKNDSSRAIAPLKAAPDAIVIDSTNLTIQEVIETMIYYINKSLI
ncbi:MAG: (d)CMP kinase [Desulfobacterales bacterium]|nr:(d)CMP kinase [Desulfobacterales bacterium]